MTQAAYRLLAAAPLPLSVTGCLLCVALVLTLHEYGAMSLGSWAGAGLALCDALSRLAECRRVRRMLFRHGFDHRVLAAMAASRCQRDAALCAAGQAGFRDQAKAYYRSRGFRWYHLFPNGWSRAPWRLVTPRFLTQSFLAFRHRHRIRD